MAGEESGRPAEEAGVDMEPTLCEDRSRLNDQLTSGQRHDRQGSAVGLHGVLFAGKVGTGVCKSRRGVWLVNYAEIPKCLVAFPRERMGFGAIGLLGVGS